MIDVLEKINVNADWLSEKKLSEKTGMLIIGKGEDAMDIVFSGGN